MRNLNSETHRSREYIGDCQGLLVEMGNGEVLKGFKVSILQDDYVKEIYSTAQSYS